jgi:ketosteroid isomerase-like protein
MRHPVPRLIAVVAALLVAAGVAAPLLAHDFWLVPNAFEFAPGATIEVRGQTSSAFPTSESAVTPDRIAEAKVLSAAGVEPLGDFSRAGTSLLIRHRPTSAGQRVIAISLRPRTVRESPESFRRYLRLEGAPEALDRYERQGLLPTTDSITRRYAKYAKTVVEVGRRGARSFDRAVGHPVEFVPLSDPAALRAGDTLAVRLLYRGRPLDGAKVHAGTASLAASALTDTAAARRGRETEVSLVTGSDGVFRLAVDRAALWHVRTLQIVPADAGPGADWDVHWVTLVFQVAPRAGASGATRGALSNTARTAAQPSGDSTAVADVVARYHRALADGDSAVALALLAPDAVILESGGSETRAEYRSHHLPSDIGFARAVPSVRGAVRVVVEGNTAWATSTSTTDGEFRSRPINSAGAELMVLTRGPDDRWTIRAIHWSSRARRP